MPAVGTRRGGAGTASDRSVHADAEDAASKAPRQLHQSIEPPPTDRWLLVMMVMEARVVGVTSGTGRSCRQRRLARDVGQAADTVGST